METKNMTDQWKIKSEEVGSDYWQTISQINYADLQGCVVRPLQATIKDMIHFFVEW